MTNTAVELKKFKYIVFIDDDYATNYYHEVVVGESALVEKMEYFMSTLQALEFFKELIKDKSAELPEVIFLDINLPEVNGWEFLDLFNELNIENPPTIVMLSTSMNPTDKERSIENPLVLELIDKPLTIEYLEKLHAIVF